MVQLVAKYGELQDPFRVTSKSAFLINGDGNLLQWLLPKTKSTYWQLNFEDRVHAMLEIFTRWRQPHMASIIRALFPKDKINVTMVTAKIYDSGCMLIHCLACNLGELSWIAPDTFQMLTKSNRGAGTGEIDEYRSGNKDRLNGVLQILHEVVNARSPLHETAQYNQLLYYLRHQSVQTPFGTLITAFADSTRPVYRNRRRLERDSLLEEVRCLCMVWLQNLEACGIDLREYGRKEKKIQATSCVSNVFTFWVIKNDGPYWVTLRKEYSFIFSYGSKPSDWTFWLLEHLESWFLDFWDMVDHPERTIPGSWVEDNQAFDAKFYFVKDGDIFRPSLFTHTDMMAYWRLRVP